MGGIPPYPPSSSCAPRRSQLRIGEIKALHPPLPTTTIVAHAVQTTSAPNLPTNSENPLTTTMYIPATSPTDGAIVSNQPTSTPQDDRATSTLAVISPTRPEQSSTSAASASEAQTQQPPVAPDNCTYSGIWRGLHVHLLLAFNI